MAKQRREIAVGQIYAKVGPGGGRWEVAAVGTDPSGAAHARLRSLVEPQTFRTFALEVLGDPRNFKLLEVPQEA